MVATALAGLPAFALPRRHHGPETARLTINAGKPGCKVDVDGVPAGTTNAKGNVVLAGITPSAHYVHVDCPQTPEATVFVSPSVGSNINVTAGPSEAGNDVGLGVGPAGNNLELRKLLSDAVDDRSNGQFPDAVHALRRAIQLDPSNAGLHHELGVTFLMIRDWPDAAVELREAIHDDPSSAGAHSELGYALEKLGDLNAALDQYRLAVHLDPQDSSYQDHYVEVLGMLAVEKAGKKKR